MDDVPVIKVGDELAFSRGYRSGDYVICTVDKITPSGRIVCGSYTLEPNLKIRGCSRWGLFYAELVTDEIRDSIARRKAISRLSTQNRWPDYSTETLNQIIAILDAATSQEPE